MKKNSNNKNGWISTLIAAGICLLLLILFMVFLFAFGEYGESEKKENEKLESNGMSFSAETYQVDVHSAINMEKYLDHEGIDTKDIAWSSDSNDMTVGSKGNITVEDYDFSGVLTAKSKKDDSVKAKCRIKSRSEEEDLAFTVEALNGEHSEVEEMSDKMVCLPSQVVKDQQIDKTKESKEPGERKDKYKWDKSLFYSLEDINLNSSSDGKINSYNIEKKVLIDKESGKEIEYEIYHDPVNNLINKVVSIEDLGEKLEIVEFYFTDEGKVNFVYTYKTVNYVPTYAQRNKSGERYFFHKDVMVNWRVIKDGKTTNYCSTKSEHNRLKDEKLSQSIKDYKDFSDSKKKDYKNKEKEILNLAYNTLSQLEKVKGISRISGYLNSADGKALKGVKTILHSDEYDKDLITVKTDKNGYYEILIPNEVAKYLLKLIKDNYLEETIYDIETSENDINMTQETVYLSEDDNEKYQCLIKFYDALNRSESGEGMAELDSPHVVIRKGVNRRKGESVYETDVTGPETYVELSAGTYTVQTSRSGYEDTYATLFVSAKTSNTVDIYATPSMGEDEYRIVLTWNETPWDLDSHLFEPMTEDNQDADDCHICYYHMADSTQNASLDVDDTNGYGPETTTIRHLQNGQYKFYVADFTNCAGGNLNSREMSNSSATVRIYGEKGLIQTFYVPTNREGVIWEVFEIRNGEIIPSQRYYNVVEDKDWWQAK